MHQRFWFLSPIEGFDSSSKFRLGSSAVHQHYRRHFGGRVIFSDPCNKCGSKKRRVLTIEDSSSEPERKRASSLDPPLSVAAPTPPPPSSPAKIILDGQSTPADMFHRWNSCTIASPATVIRDGQSTPVDLLRRLKACTITPPAAPPLHPPAPSSVLRSSSDVTLAPARGNLGNPTTVTPNQKWKETKARVEDMKHWIDSVARDEPNDDFAPPELSNDTVNKNCVQDKSVEQESGVCETVTFMHKCHCGKQFQVFLTAKSV